MLLSIRNHKGLEAMFSPRGASLQRLLMPNSKGDHLNLVLSPQDAFRPRSGCAYAGAVVGPMAGRVRNSCLVWDTVASLDATEGPHHLHGGANGLSELYWDLVDQQPDMLLFQTQLADEVGGYPGNRVFRVLYHLTNQNTLHVELSARGDVKTWFNLTSHIYWNLSGSNKETLSDHNLQIAASMVYWNRADHTLERLRDVDRSPFDLRKPQMLGSLLSAYSSNPQISLAKGFNHLFVLDPTPVDQPKLVLRHLASGRFLEVLTSLPGIWIYSGGYLENALLLEGGHWSSCGQALAIEPQLCPPADLLCEECSCYPQSKEYEHYIDFTLKTDY